MTGSRESSRMIITLKFNSLPTHFQLISNSLHPIKPSQQPRPSHARIAQCSGPVKYTCINRITTSEDVCQV